MELGIKGHETRGDEIIKILEMLGGKNRHEMRGGIYDKYFYYIDDEYKDISYSYIGPDEIKGYEIFSLEDFLEKFPYKVGDKVEVWVFDDYYLGRTELVTSEIKSMRWNSARCEIAYRLKDICKEFYKSDIKGKVNDEENKMNDCKKCGLHFGLVQCFYKDCPHNTPKSYAVGLMDDKVNESEVNKEIVMNENKPLFKPGDVVKLKGCPDKNLFWIVMDVIKDGYIFNNGKKYSFDDQHHFEKSNREVINLQPDKISYLSINNEKYADQIEIDLGDNYEYKFEMNKLYIVKKNPKYSKTYEEDNYCETLEIKVLGHKVGDVIFTNDTGWIRITKKLWDCYTEEHVYEGIGIINGHEYKDIRHHNVTGKMQLGHLKHCKDEDPQIDYSAEILKSMGEETGKRLAELTMNTVFTTAITHEYLEERGFTLPDGYHFADKNGNVIDVTEILLVKNPPYYPKTYAECCDVLNIPNDERYIDIDVPLDYNKLLSAFTELLICRDAYWKIAGEQMGLGKPWKPDFSDDSPKYNIFRYENEITLSDNNWSNRILAFPTIEMRNAFYENFKDLIKQCKELF